MSAPRVRGTKPLLFLNTLLLSTALALPAMAQIEEVVVTAQKRAENVQNVPIAISAFTGQDLKTEQIQQFKDLQFHAPNVTYTAGNFGGSDFQVRGIGITAVGYGAESGVAINFDEVYLAAPELTESAFYDLSGVEILAGPQNTLYGRGATGGAVNVNIAKPDLERAYAQLVGVYGNFNTYRTQGVINVPLVDNQLAFRLAGDWDKRDGFVTNLFDNKKVDGLSWYSVRPSLRWQPSEKTTIDITGQFTSEDDNHLRADKQLCTTDPTGVLGCLPGSAGFGTVNPYSTLSVIASSQQGLENVLGGLGTFLGLYNIQGPQTFTANPGGIRQINTDFQPVSRYQDNFLQAKWHQTITPWLDSTLILGYDRNSYFSQQDYNNYPGQLLPRNTNTTPTGFPFPVNTANCLAAAFGAPNLDCAESTFLTVLTAAGGPAYAANFAKYFALPGELPKSIIGGFGLTGNHFFLTPRNESSDQGDGEASEYSAEWRFATNFAGPINALLGLYYLHTQSHGDYYVNATSLDYPGIILGGLSGLANPGLCFSTGCILSPSYYRNQDENNTLTSKGVFGEVYYQVIPDTFKLTGGLRFTQDDKFNTGRILLYSALVPIGTTSESFIPNTPGTLHGDIPVKQTFDAFTGRVVANWTPKLDFTDQTLVYLSYATGYKAGGANPNVEPGLPVSQTYSPENIVAYELGTKNLLLGNTLQANGDVYYYNYKGLQVSEIVNNTSVNNNIAAHVYGAEGNFIWQATERLQLGLNIAHEESNIQNTSLVDAANPTGGNPRTLLIKDDSISATTGQNCVLFFNSAFPGLPAGYVAPLGGVHALAGSGIPNVAFGSCNPAALTAAAAAQGYNPPDFTPGDPQTSEGQAVSLNGHELQNTPNLSLGVNAQYTQPLPSDYSLVARVDFHWQSHFFGNIFEDGGSFVKSEEVTNATLQLNSPDDVWYAQVYVRNIFDANNITGEYVSSQTSGLFTNAFLGDPRTYGVELGVKFE